jgi:hypothetical protein
VQPGRERQAGNAATHRRDRHSIENIVECFELEPAAGPLGDDTTQPFLTARSIAFSTRIKRLSLSRLSPGICRAALALILRHTRGHGFQFTLAHSSLRSRPLIQIACPAGRACCPARRSLAHARAEDRGDRELAAARGAALGHARVEDRPQNLRGAAMAIKDVPIMFRPRSVRR